MDWIWLDRAVQIALPRRYKRIRMGTSGDSRRTIINEPWVPGAKSADVSLEFRSTLCSMFAQPFLRHRLFIKYFDFFPVICCLLWSCHGLPRSSMLQVLLYCYPSPNRSTSQKPGIWRVGSSACSANILSQSRVTLSVLSFPRPSSSASYMQILIVSFHASIIEGLLQSYPLHNMAYTYPRSPRMMKSYPQYSLLSRLLRVQKPTVSN